MIKQIHYQSLERTKVYLGIQKVWSSIWSPLDLFKDGKQGVWYDPSDKSTLFQDAEGTIPVTKDGDPVALMRDKSGNDNHATQAVSAARPIYKTDGILHWLAFDGVDDYLGANTFGIAMAQPLSLAMASKATDILGRDYHFIFDSYSPNRYSINFKPDRSLSASSTAGAELILPVGFMGEKIVSSLIANGTGSTFQVNNNAATAAEFGNVALGNLLIAKFALGNYYYGKLDFYGIILLEGVENTDKVKSYLAKKTGVTL